MTRQRIETVLARLSDNIIIKSIRQGLLLIMPLIMVGSFVLMILNLPVPVVNDTLTGLFGEHWRTLGLAIHKGTFRVMSLSALLSISYCLGRSWRIETGSYSNSMAVMLTAFSCYVTFDSATDFVLDENATGPTGMFGAIVIALLSTSLFHFFHMRLPRKQRLFAFDSDAILMSSLSNVLPTLCTISLFALARILFDAVGVPAAMEAANLTFNNTFLHGNGIVTTLLYNLVTHVMWFFGIHGTNVMETVARDLFVTASETNIALAAEGLAPTQILTKEFFDVFVYMGGAGCTLGLIIALVVGGKTGNAGGMARYSAFPGLFNINEVIVYGLPIIFNPYYLVPFLVTPIALSLTSYFAFSTGLVPLTTQRVVWTTPILLSGYASTGSVGGVILQLVNLAAATCIYLPFVRLYERHLSQINKKAFEELCQAYLHAQPDCTPKMLDRSDELGMIARSLTSELERFFQRPDSAGLRLEYQPKTLWDGRVFGAEALLRWTHPVFGNISPIVVQGLTDEAGLTNQLGNWVFATAFAQASHWRNAGHRLNLSINLSPLHLREDNSLPETIVQLISKYELDPSLMEVELTEHAAVDQSISTRYRLQRIKSLGVSISIDDFGMGNSSLLYLRDLYANVVKIDISLVHAIIGNTQSQEIVRSIIALCRQLDVGIVAEGVETESQLKMLRELGCTHFQGWLFSRSLTPEQFLSYIEIQGCEESSKLHEPLKMH